MQRCLQLYQTVQVYLATLQETPCAVKLLMGCDEAAAVRSGDSSLSLSMPIMQELQKVGRGWPRL